MIRPNITALDTRRAVQERAETRHRRFEPVSEYGDTRRDTAERLGSLIWRAVFIAIGLGWFVFSAVSCGALVKG